LVPVDVPCTFVVATDDSCTTGYADRYADWRSFVAELDLQELDGGGHFFTRTRPEQVAGLVARTLGRYT
jgi:pimeloyl-ACP methyl ester carboxylesterase